MMLLADWQLTGPLLTLWPFRDDVWREHGQPAQQQLIALAEQLHGIHPFYIGVHPSELARAQRILPHSFHHFTVAYNDAWARDIGPLWTQLPGSQQVHAQGFQFSAWHGLYPDFHDDQQFAQRLAQRLRLPFQQHPLILEGGALTTDGAGTIVVHAASVLRNNPHWSRAAVEQLFHEELGVQQVYWLEFAHPDDETGGHVDNQVQFLSADTLVVAMPQPQGRYWESYHAQLQQIQRWRNTAGQAYRIVQVPQPEPLAPIAADYVTVRQQAQVYPRGVHPLLASYVNFIRVAEVLIVPQFDLATDAEALALLRQAAPELTVLGVAADEFIKAGGALHCMTLHTPATAVWR